MVKYSRESSNPTKSAKAMGRDLRVHFKNTRETAHALRKLPLAKAKRYLEDVIAHKQAIPFRRYCRGVGRTAQAKARHSNGQGRWPVKSARFILDLLKNAESSADVKGLDVDALYIYHIQLKIHKFFPFFNAFLLVRVRCDRSSIFAPRGLVSLMAAAPPSNPWGSVSRSEQIKNKGFLNLDAGDCSPPRSRSFKEVLSCGTSSGDVLPNLSQTTFNGVPAILLTDDEVLKMDSPFQFTLVENFGLNRPNLDSIRMFFTNLKLLGFFSIGLLDSRHVAIQLSNDLDYSRVFARRSYFIFNCQMRVLKWTQFFDIKEESPIVPIWISFPNLRLHFFTQLVLHALGSIFRRPLQTDQATASRTRPSMARILVEVDITKKHSKEIWVGSKAYGYMQKSNGKHGSTEKIYVPIGKVDQSMQVEPLPLSDNPEDELVALQVSQNTSNVDITNIEENHDTLVNNVAVNDPKIFISINSMLNDINTIKDAHSDLNPITTTIVEKHSNSIPIDVANKEGKFFVDGNNDACEEGEFVLPTNGEHNVLHNENNVSNAVASSSITNIANQKGLDEDDFSKAGKKKGKNSKNSFPSTPQSTRDQNSSKYLNHGVLGEAEAKVLELDNTYLVNPSMENLNNLNSAKVSLVQLQDHEEIFWKQKANVKFTIEGDRNTKFFYAMANRNRTKNYIHKIVNSDGSTIEAEELICKSGVEYFKNSFNDHFSNVPLINPQIIPHIINDIDNNFLCLLPSDLEIYNAIMDLNGDSIAGPDGYTSKFFQKCWDIVKFDVIEVNDFFNGSPYPKYFTSTNIVFIPKTDGANKWKDFRPISFCSFFNKLISKIISKRLESILPRISSSNQTGFVKGRSIFDNVLLTQELALDINTKFMVMRHLNVSNSIQSLKKFPTTPLVSWDTEAASENTEITTPVSRGEIHSNVERVGNEPILISDNLVILDKSPNSSPVKEIVDNENTIKESEEVLNIFISVDSMLNNVDSPNLIILNIDIIDKGNEYMEECEEGEYILSEKLVNSVEKVDNKRSGDVASSSISIPKVASFSISSEHVANNWNATVFHNNNIHGMARLWAKLSRLKQLLRWWNKNVFKNIFVNIKEAEEKVLVMDSLFMENPSSDNLSNLDNAKLHLFNLQNQEEIYWKQKSSASIILEGDRNTSFFHALANKNKIKSHIHRLVDNQGCVYDTEDSIVTLGVEYFKDILNAAKTTITITNPNVIPKLVGEEDNLMLNQLPMEEEIWNTIKNMNGDYVAGPDGFTTNFFVKTWDIVKINVVEAMHDFFSAIHFGVNVNVDIGGKMDRVVRWLKPSFPYVKINTDGSDQANSVGMAELLGLSYGLDLCVRLGFQHVNIERSIGVLGYSSLCWFASLLVFGSWMDATDFIFVLSFLGLPNRRWVHGKVIVREISVQARIFLVSSSNSYIDSILGDINYLFLENYEMICYRKFVLNGLDMHFLFLGTACLQSELSFKLFLVIVEKGTTGS
ncbi:hypothetical protein KFK09_004915 [Dendrobium nobile]|uniref:DUF4283 domain-containing protein n=1 Tax=Dendrobium nobile TaxID=94219 RepID=A0A8T3BZI2_DENNO|nr:hypothetical protein KFK09_004915 [Dendrobium nobile]